MITKLPYSDMLLDYLNPYFEHKQYLIAPDAMHYKRRTSFGHASIICQLSEAENGQYLSFYLGVRHGLVEQVLASLYGQSGYYKSDSHTLLLDWRLFAARRDSKMIERTIITQPQDLETVCDQFIDFMDRKGFDFLDKYKSLKAIDYLYNDKPNTSAILCKHHYQRCFRGMLTAIILNRPDLPLVKQMHRAYLLSRGFAGSVIQKFDITFDKLANISLN